MQTLGLTSLVLRVIGYGAGRLRELRDPQAALAPIAVGAAATAVATIGYSIVQFLLGVDAPVSLAAAAPDRWPRSSSTRSSPARSSRSSRRACSRALPDDPRRRRRRAYTTGGLSPLSRCMIEPAERPPRPDLAAAGPARGDPRRDRAGAVRDHLLPAVVPAGALRRPVPQQANDQPGRARAHPGAARGRSSTAREPARRATADNVVQLDPAAAREREAARAWGQQVIAEGLALQGPQGRPDRDPARAGATCKTRFARLARSWRCPRRDPGRSCARCTSRASRPRRSASASPTPSGLLEERQTLPGRHVERVYLRSYPNRRCRPAARHRRARSRQAAQADGLPRGSSRDRRRPGRPGVPYDRYLRGPTAPARRSTRRATPRARQTRRAGGRQDLKLSLDLGLQREGAGGAARGQRPARSRGAFVAMDPRNGEVLAMGS